MYKIIGGVKIFLPTTVKDAENINKEHSDFGYIAMLSDSQGH